MTQEKVNTAFVVPSWYYWNNPVKQQPLTQLYLATILERFTNANIDLIDLRGNPKIKIPEKDIFFYSFTSPDFQEMINLSKRLRDKYPKAKHVAGGIHTSWYPKESLKFFDSVVVGEGEEALIEIIQNHPKLERIYKRKSDKVYPFPKRHFLPEERVIVDDLFKSEEIRATTAFFSHGCPYQCGFCANYNPRKINRNSLNKIIEEIDYLKSEYQIKGLSLTDDVCIPLKESYALEYLNEIKKKGIKWRGQTRAGIPKHILKLARESGCLELTFGVESASQNVLDIVNKKIKLETIKSTVKDCKEVGIKTQITLINGLPGESKNIIELTKFFVQEVNPNYTLLCSLVVYPGSPFFNNPKKYGIKSIDANYENHQVLIHRFKDTEINKKNTLNFKYSNGFSEKKILDNLFELQDFLIEGGYNK